MDSTDTTTALQAALQYADRGWRVFPCHGVTPDGSCTCGKSRCQDNPKHRGKHPRTRNGLLDATTDKAVIEGWSKQWPTANVGIVTGPASRLLVIDIDDPAGLGQLEAELGELPLTLEAATGRGGRHLIYMYPDGAKISSSANKIAPGVDIRATGGYIIAPPSKNAAGPYAWTDTGVDDPEELPVAWVARLQAPEQSEQPEQPEQPQPLDVDECRAQLAVIPADGYQSWVDVGMSLHSTGDPHAFELWDTWSKASDKYDGSDQRHTWRSFKDRANGLGMGTLVHLAKEHGWKVDPTFGLKISDVDTSKAEPEEPKGKQADRLIKLAQDADLYHSPDGMAYADIRVNGHRETRALEGRAFRNWLCKQFYGVERTAPSKDALSSAIAVLTATAMFSGECREVFVRIGGEGGRVYYDLGDETWRAIEIDETGWRIGLEPPVRFRRPAGMRPQVPPEPGGDIAALRPFLNVSSEGDFALLVGWLVAALRHLKPFPTLAVTGEQGSAKSTLCGRLRELVDPNAAPLRSLPREEKDLYIAAMNGHVLAFDNISYLRPWIADALCRLVTGGSYASRQLFTDQDEVLLQAARPILLNGIEDIVDRADLADRTIILELNPIPDSKRRTEAEMDAEFDRARPRILGALFDGVSCGLRRLPSMPPCDLPRLADFVLWATACGNPEDQDVFRTAFELNRRMTARKVLDAQPVAVQLRRFVVGRPHWRGTAQALLGGLETDIEETDKRHRAWPKSARALSQCLRRCAPDLRREGINIQAPDPKKGGDRIFVIETRGTP